MRTMVRQQRIILAVLLSGGLLAFACGCQSRPKRVYKVNQTEPQSAQSWAGSGSVASASFPAGQTPGRFLVKSAVEPAAPSNVYHLGPGDVLEIRVQQLLDPDKETIQRVTIDQQGQIFLPVLNQIQAAGLTVSQMRQDLIQKLGQEYIRNPEVDVDILSYRSKEVIVLGMVRQPGAVYLRSDNATLLDVIGLAGGINGESGPFIEILRGAYQPGMPNTQAYWNAEWKTNDQPGYFNRDVVAVSELFAESGSQVNPVIYPGDVVKVRAAQEGYIYLAGQVLRPGAKRFYRPLNVMQAISMAGGLSPIAEEKACKIVRREASGQEQVIHVDLEKIESGEHRNLELERNDLVTVPVNPHKKFWHTVAGLFRAGVRAGVDLTYDAGEDFGIPGNGSGF